MVPTTAFSAARVRIANATLPVCLTEADGLLPDDDGLARADLILSGGRIEAILPPGAPASPVPEPALGTVDLDDGLVLPGLVDIHTHLDKSQTWPRAPNPDGAFFSALEVLAADKPLHWTPEDVRRRMDFSLRTAYAHGTTAIRTHIDSTAPQHAISWPVLAEMREKWAGRITLQGSALMSAEWAAVDPAFEEVARVAAEHGGLVGAATTMSPNLEAGVERLLRLAMARGVDIDFHVDEPAEVPLARALDVIARVAIRLGFPHRILCGHCCSLAARPDDEARHTLDLMAAAGMSVVSLPMCNLFLQDRVAGRTPRWRGVTLLHELKARGIPVAIASDNTRDAFYAYGDMDLVEVLREGTRILHLDRPVGDWPRIVAATPADIMGLPDHGRIRAGLPADISLFSARTWTELHSRPQSDRIVLRNGIAIDRTLPDYRELDDLMPPRR